MTLCIELMVLPLASVPLTAVQRQAEDSGSVGGRPEHLDQGDLGSLSSAEKREAGRWNSSEKNSAIHEGAKRCKVSCGSARPAKHLPLLPVILQERLSSLITP